MDKYCKVSIWFRKIRCFVNVHKNVSKKLKCINKGFYDEESWYEYECSSCGKKWEREI